MYQRLFSELLLSNLQQLALVRWEGSHEGEHLRRYHAAVYGTLVAA